MWSEVDASCKASVAPAAETQWSNQEAVYQASRVFWHYAGYSWDNVHEMEELCRRLKHPVTFPVRASLMAQSLPQLSWLLQQSDRWSLTRTLSSDDVFRTRFYWNLLAFFLLKMLSSYFYSNKVVFSSHALCCRSQVHANCVDWPQWGLDPQGYAAL